MTNVEEELKVLNSWRLKPGLNNVKVFEQLVRNEFVGADLLKKNINQRLSWLTKFAALTVPFYKNYVDQQGLAIDDVDSIDQLQLLPIIDKKTLVTQEQAFRAENLPASEKLHGYAYSSGTTGKRTRVLMTQRSSQIFTFLVLRHYRWFRMDLLKTMAVILSPRSFSDPLDEFPDEFFESHSEHWTYAGGFFETGPSVSLSGKHPFKKQQAWLHKHQPSYLISNPRILEEHAFAKPEGVLNSLDSVVGITAQMTQGMRKRIESGFKVPVNQSYGLNEIGLVAGRCQFGRYHIHVEHCLVEIVDMAGNTCKEGEEGRVLVSSLNNLAMPFFRYDTGDMATFCQGACACGLTLPAIENIQGRYRRWIHVPPGTRKCFYQIEKMFDKLPSELLKDVIGHQLHLNLDDTLVFKIASRKPLSTIIEGQLLSDWAKLYPEEKHRLTIKYVDGFDVPIHGKTPEFTTDYDELPKNFSET